MIIQNIINEKWCVVYPHDRETNDGGAVHDRYLRDFTNRHITSYLQTQQGSCGGGDCEAGTPGQGRYTTGDMRFTLTCYNPAATDSMHGLRVLQQITPHRKSQLKVSQGRKS